MEGEMRILNCCYGDTELKIGDASDPSEVERFKKILKDMMSRGYAIFVREPDGSLRRVRGFSPDFDSYLIREDERGEKSAQRAIRRAKAVAVPRTAGG